uniref:Uncharacterized protein n=1 Tax=Anopheles culicifacies TaxID=139723 RepID=A0A182MJM5_9DIPT
MDRIVLHVYHSNNLVDVHVDGFCLCSLKIASRKSGHRRARKAEQKLNVLINNRCPAWAGNKSTRLTGGSNSFCSSSYSHISTASRFRIRLIWCEPYFAVRNFSRRSFTSPFSVKLTRSPVRPGERSQSFMVSTPHCMICRLQRRRTRGRSSNRLRCCSTHRKATAKRIEE